MSSTTESHASHHGYIGDKKRYLQRMKRIEGLARGIANMIDEEQYCIHILTQVSALTRSLQGWRRGCSMITRSTVCSMPPSLAMRPPTRRFRRPLPRSTG